VTSSPADHLGSPTTLAEELIAALPADVAERFAAAPASEIGETLERFLREGEAATPGAKLAPHVFVRFVAERLAAAGGGPELLARLHGADLFLACACAGGQPAALAAFERRCSAVSATLRRYGDAAFVADVLQDLRERMLLGGPGRAPRIREYSGQGSLDGWFRVAAVRHALNSARRGPRAREEDLSADPLLEAPDPELRAMKREHRDAFAAAVREALATLRPEDRTLISLYLSDKLTIPQIGAIFQVNRSTVVRRLADCRMQILDEVRRRLVERLKMGRDEADSLIRFLQSQLDASVLKVLGEDNPKES
jgi:RNA polymerase sigma-70 factor, ECF subfamily